MDPRRDRRPVGPPDRQTASPSPPSRPTGRAGLAAAPCGGIRSPSSACPFRYFVSSRTPYPPVPAESSTAETSWHGPGSNGHYTPRLVISLTSLFAGHPVG